MAEAKASTTSKSSAKKSDNVWSEEERAAMQASVRERKKSARLSPDEERAAGEIVSATAPDLVPRTYYGMPGFARDGKVICFFQSKAKFKVRYCTLGFQPDARLDEGKMWPVAYALTSLTAADEKRIAALVKKAVG